MARKKKQNHNFLKIIIAGTALVGAGALAAVAAMSDEDTKKKFDKNAKRVGDKTAEFATEAYHEAAKQFDELKVKLEKLVEDGKRSQEYKKALDSIDRIADRLNDASKTNGKDLENITKEVKKYVDELKDEFENMSKK